MKAKPILFSPPMVRAIIEGRKTQTRRIVKITKMDPHLAVLAAPKWAEPGEAVFIDQSDPVGGGALIVQSPYKPGDLLWVRERFFNVRPYRNAPIFDGLGADFIYEADIHNALDGDHRFDSWAPKDRARMRRAKVIGCHRFGPSIHMPREACRLWLKVEAVRVERVQDITEADAIAEGVPFDRVDKVCRPAFASIWNSINGADSWNANPWVWVYTFSRAEKPHEWPGPAERAKR